MKKLVIYKDIESDHFYDCIIEFEKALKNVKHDNLIIFNRIKKFPHLLRVLRVLSKYISIPSFV